MERVKHVLCVDDDELSRFVFNRTIKKAGNYVVTEASSGSDCLNLLSQQAFDLIILDYELGDLNGFDVCREIAAKSLNPDVAVIISSVVDRDELRRANSSRNVVKIVQKPYLPTQILSDIESILAS